MHLKETRSPLVVVTFRVAVVVELADCEPAIPLVRSFTEQAQPVGAVKPVAPFMVMTGEQIPVVVVLNWPDVAPPAVFEIVAQPDATVNFVPVDMYPEAFHAPAPDESPPPSESTPAAVR